MNRRTFTLWLRFAIDRFTRHIEHASLCHITNRHLNRRTRTHDLVATLQTVRTAHRDGAHHTLAQVLRHLERQYFVLTLHCQRVVHRRQCHVFVKFDINHHADNLDNFSSMHFFLLIASHSSPPHHR